MDPIERLNLFITMWEQWINSNKNYKYHGVNMQCKSKLLYVPIYKGLIGPKLPPVYYVFQYTGDESSGWVSVYFSRFKEKLLSFFNASVLFFHMYATLNYDTLNIAINNPKCDGSFIFDVKFWYPSCGVYDDSIVNWNCLTYSYALNTPLFSYSDSCSKCGYYREAALGDRWKWLSYPKLWSLTYMFNWSYNKITNTYDIWDNQNNKKFGVSSTVFFSYLRVQRSIRTGNYPGTCFRYLGVEVNNLIFYSGNLIPHP